ncbi:DUF2771 family protein [Tsukamurella sp. 8F]|uniref:DUF2771 family protein n=1 Tax=unclassified Tsukamurella TaxID=2633480 RepID=UPI0023B972F5|nr:MULTISPECIES: DUF2771 family protein [unclassified Tsukamurella]MDF0529829.1 DUF2771 family protein [Tsukamurella sp. 8J]MDF0587021.1 DUF2771 family protein [Tsukamurella sp. 8F]
MIPKPSRNVVIAAVAALVVAAIAIGLTVFAAVRHNRDAVDRPQLSVAGPSGLRYVSPYLYCDDVGQGRCDPKGSPAKIPLEPGQTIWVSMPSYISERPWDVSVQYLFPGGASTVENTTHLEPGQSMLTLMSKPDALVAQIEVHVPSVVQDSFGNLLTQAAWSIDTLPAHLAPKR